MRETQTSNAPCIAVILSVFVLIPGIIRRIEGILYIHLKFRATESIRGLNDAN